MTSGFERRAFAADAVRPRRTAFTFSTETPRHWINGSVAHTHLMNALHVFLPPFERMITQIVRHHALPIVKDPVLIEQARGFMGQESTHARCHEQFCSNLRAQGYSIDRYMSFLEWVFGHFFLRRLGATLSLSMVSAFEHYTDLFVPLILESDFLDGCDPALRELLEWHIAEEIEHNAVALSLLRAIDDGEGLRLIGNVLGLGVIFTFLVAATLMLVAQERKLIDRTVLRELYGFFFGKYRIVPTALELFVDYARLSYQPNDKDYSHLARPVLAGP